MLQLLLVVVAAAFFISSIHGSSFSGCNQSCGSNSVPYPFGFSQGCPIVLNCSSPSSSVQIFGGFQVRNLTSDSLVIDIPPSCNRSITASTSVGAFFGQNYAMTWKNVLLVRGCAKVPPALDDCAIPTALLSRRLDLSGSAAAAAGGDSITCLSTDREKGFLNESAVLSAGCGFLFTSIGFEESGGGTPTLVFRTAELGWWLDGTCRCSADAACTSLTSPATGKGGFRCRCHDGFEGDGFADGRGCRKAIAPRCNPSKYVSGDCGGGGGTSSRVALLVGGIAAGATVMAGLGLACFFIRRHSSSCRLRRSTKRLLSQASCTVPLYSYKDIDRATNGFSDSQRLGTGAYGTVYAGRLDNDTLVAVKKIKHASDGIEQVINEVKLLSSVSHPNLVRLLGCCVERGQQILVYEFMPNGTLAQHLQRERGPPLPWTVRLTIAAETAKAIAYLHSSIHPPIYHRDVKSSNILLGYNFSSKVADFGLSRMGMTSESSHISTAPQGTPGYLDPQYHQNFHLSDKSDVYSFGVVLVEIITALKAVDFSRDQSEVNLAALAIEKIGKGCVDDIVDPYLDPNRDAWTLSSINKVAELAFRCLAFHRDMRPSMIEVADELELIRFSGWAPTDDIVFTASSSLRSSSGSTNNIATDKYSIRSKTGSRRHQLVSVPMPAMEVKVDSPVSVVQDPWFSEQSSPSSNCLLPNSTH